MVWLLGPVPCRQLRRWVLAFLVPKRQLAADEPCICADVNNKFPLNVRPGGQHHHVRAVSDSVLIVVVADNVR